MKRDKISIYLSCAETKVKAVLDCTIKLRIGVGEIGSKRILWPRAKGWDAGPNARSIPNQFVPVIKSDEALRAIVGKDATLQQKTQCDINVI